MERSSVLFEPYLLGDLEIKNRVGMAPLTRQRCKNDGVPTDSHVIYYSERASDAGFVITECSAVSPVGNSFIGSAAIYSKEQVEGWKKVTDAVHKVGGKIFLQIWHCGRSAHSKVTGYEPVAPSQIRNRHKGRVKTEFEPYDEPHELSKEEIQEVINQFHQGAINAKEAGFDGLELHSANGYLSDQFLRDASNKRADSYGGSIEKRCTFTLEVIDKLIEVFGPSRVGIKISPCGRFNDMFDSDPLALCKHLLSELGKRKIAFIEVAKAPDFRKVDNHYGIEGEDQIEDIFGTLKSLFAFENSKDLGYNPTFIANNGIDFEAANKLVSEGKCDLVTFGRTYISNPDLVERFKNGWELTSPQYETFYTQGDEGYISYSKYKSETEK